MYYLVATCLFQGIHFSFLGVDCFLSSADGLREVREVGAPGDEVPLDKVDTILGRNMHEGSFVDLPLHCFGGVNVPDMVGVGEVQQRGFGGNGGHQASTTCDGEMDAAMLAFQAANEMMDGVERAVCAYLVYDVIERLIIELQDMRAQMDGLPAHLITVADELGIETVYGVLQAWV